MSKSKTTLIAQIKLCQLEELTHHLYHKIGKNRMGKHRRLFIHLRIASIMFRFVSNTDNRDDPFTLLGTNVY